MFKPNNFRDVQKLNQDKGPKDMTLGEYKYLTSVCWDKKNIILSQMIWLRLILPIVIDWLQIVYSF